MRLGALVRQTEAPHAPTDDESWCIYRSTSVLVGLTLVVDARLIIQRRLGVGYAPIHGTSLKFESSVFALIRLFR